MVQGTPLRVQHSRRIMMVEKTHMCQLGVTIRSVDQPARGPTDRPAQSTDLRANCPPLLSCSAAS